MPGIGSLTKAAGAYQQTFCYYIGEAIDMLYYEPEDLAAAAAADMEEENEYTPSYAPSVMIEPDDAPTYPREVHHEIQKD